MYILLYIYIIYILYYLPYTILNLILFVYYTAIFIILRNAVINLSDTFRQCRHYPANVNISHLF